MIDNPTAGEVIAKLAALGSADQIADHFERVGVRGRTGRAQMCPLARYVRVECDREVTVTWASIITGGVRDLLLPEPVSEFVANFDRGVYPGLVEPSPVLVPVIHWSTA